MSEADHIDTLFARYGPSYKWLATFTVMMGAIATVLTSTIVNVAIPDIMGALGMNQDQAQLLSTGFIAAMTGTMLLNAWMVDAVGQRATYMLAVSVFIAASFMGGLAPNPGILILARVLQGAAAGILQPLSMQVIFLVFPASRRGMAMGIYGIGVVLAPALGPAVGGIMIDSLSWHYVFFLAVPFSALGLLLAPLYIPPRAESAPAKRFDWIGFALMSVFLFTLLNGLSNGQRHGWYSHLILQDLAISVVTAVGFVFWELHTPAPMLNLKVFLNPAFAGASIVGFIFGAGIFGSTYLVPLFAQIIQGYSATDAGLLLMPAGLAMAVAFPIAGRIADKAPAYLIVMSGLCVFALSSFLMKNIDTNTPFWMFAWWIVLGRVSLAFIMPALNVGALKALPLAWLSQGAGAINFVRQLGGAFGVNLLTILLERRSQLYIQTFTASQDGTNTVTAALLRDTSGLLAQAGVQESVRQAGAIDYLAKVIYAQGSMMGYRDGFLAVAMLFFIAMLPAFMLRARTVKAATRA